MDIKSLKKEKLIRCEREPYRYFEPTVKGEEFIDLVGSGKYFISLYSAANGIGKTATAVNMLAHLFYPCGNKYFRQSLWLNWPFIKKGRIVSDPVNIEDNIIPELKKWLPNGRYKTSKKGKHFESYWEIDTGFSFTIMSYEQEPKEFEGSTLGWVWMDEPPPGAIYKANVSRLRLGGLMMLTATPINQDSVFLYDTIIANKDNEKGKRAYVQADVWSACKDILGTRGHLSREHINNMIAQYDEDDLQARVHGKPQHLLGLIFKQFDRKIHVIRPFDINSEDYCVWEMLDSHPRNPDAVAWGGIDRQGTKYIIDELYVNVDGRVGELVNRIKNKAGQYRIEKRLIEPAAFNEDQHHKNFVLAKFLQKKGLNYQKATKFRATADRAISDALDYHSVGGSIVKPPELYIFDTCKRVIKEFEHYRWDNWVGKKKDKKMLKEKHIDKDDHMIENIGRFLIQDPQFIEPVRYIMEDQDMVLADDPY